MTRGEEEQGWRQEAPRPGEACVRACGEGAAHGGVGQVVAGLGGPGGS